MTAFGGALTDPTKIMGSRIGAYIVDLILATLAVGLVFVTVDASKFETRQFSSSFDAQRACDFVNRQDFDGQRNGICFASGTTARVMQGDDVQAMQVHLWLAWAGFGLLNYVVLTAVVGGTLGKLLFGLRVVTNRGQRAGFGRNLVRWLFLIIDQACCFLPGLLTSFNSKGHRRVGDMVAGTYVIHRSAEGRLLHIPGHLVVKGRHEYGSFGPAPIAAEPTLGTGGGIDAPVFDPSRNTYVRYDQVSGVWFQWDDTTQSWIPARQ